MTIQILFPMSLFLPSKPNLTYHYIRVPYNPSVIVYPVLPSYYYTEAVPFKVQITSKLNNSITKQVQEQITIVNTQEYVSVNQQAVQESGISTIVVTQNVSRENPQVFNFACDDWFDGPVLGLTVHCDDCGEGKIQLKNRVEEIPIGLGFMQGVIDSVFSHHTGKAYFLKDNSIHIYGMPGYMDTGPAYPLNFTHEFGDTVLCERLIKGEDKNYTVLEYVFAMCYDTQRNSYVVAPLHLQSGNYTAIPALSLDVISKLGEVQYKDGFLLVQNLQLDAYGQSSIIVYDLYNDMLINKSAASKKREFNSNYPNVGSRLNISSFQVFNTDHQEARVLFFVNFTQTLYYCILNTTDYSILIYKPDSQTWDHINLYQNLKSHNGYILPTSSFRTLRIVDFQIGDLLTNEVALEYSIIISTSNTASYNVMVALQSTTATDHKTILDYEIQYAFQNYGSNYILDRIETYDKFFAIAYWNILENKITVAVYNRQATPSHPIGSQKYIALRQMIGGYEFQYGGVGKIPTPAFMFVPGLQTDTELFVNSPGSTQSSHHFALNPQNISIVVTDNDFQRQQLTFYAVSDYAIYLHQFSSVIDQDFVPPIPPFPGDIGPSCTVNRELNNFNLISEVGELSRWPLQNFITGFNLTYKFNETYVDLRFKAGIQVLNNKFTNFSFFRYIS